MARTKGDVLHVEDIFCITSRACLMPVTEGGQGLVGPRRKPE